MPKKPRVRCRQQGETTGYPSLREHLASRRHFLGWLGASLAAGGLTGTCDRAVGVGGAGDGSLPDAQVDGDGGARPTDGGATPDAQARAPGGEQWPDYFTLRVPDQGEMVVPLQTYGYVHCHVDAATGEAATHEALQAHLEAAQRVCEELLAEYSYEALCSLPGFAEAEDRAFEVLDELAMELCQHERSTLAAVALHIAGFEPWGIVGMMKRPRFPEAP